MKNQSITVGLLAAVLAVLPIHSSMATCNKLISKPCPVQPGAPWTFGTPCGVKTGTVVSALWYAIASPCYDPIPAGFYLVDPVCWDAIPGEGCTPLKTQCNYALAYEGCTGEPEIAYTGPTEMQPLHAIPFCMYICGEFP